MSAPAASITPPGTPKNIPNPKNVPQVEVYSTLGCKFCRMAKFKLDELGVPYVAVDVTEPSAPADVSQVERQGLRVEYARQRTVPQIYVGEELVGGCDKLLEEVTSGAFFERLGRHDVIITPPATTTTPSSSSSSSSSPSTVTATPPPPPLSPLIGGIREGVLNSISPSDPPPPSIDPLLLSSLLQRSALTLADTFSSQDGSRIDYKSMRSSTEFKEYSLLSQSLKECSLEGIVGMGVNKRISFFVNLYNAMIIHANCVLGPPSTPEGRSALYNGKGGARYDIGGHVFSPDDIEHGVLRGNTPHPSQTSSSSYMNVWDERAVLALPYLDPRMHFVLNCGAVSCPPIRILGEDPELALSSSAAAYLEGEIVRKIEVESGLMKVFLPKLSLWYTLDFGRDMKSKAAKLMVISKEGGRARGVLKDLLAEYRDSEEIAKSAVGLSDEEREALRLQGEKDIDDTVRYNPYNWTANDVEE